MKQRLFNLLDKINRHGIDNSKWGLVQDIPSTRIHFGSKVDIELNGQWLYIELNEDDADYTVVESPNVLESDFTLSIMECDGEFLFLYEL